MSLTPCFNMAILSIPNPNANPLYLSEFILQFSRTIGFTMPQPSTSNHFPSFDNISTSADGSVKGKYEGRNLNSTSLPKSENNIL